MHDESITPELTIIAACLVLITVLLCVFVLRYKSVAVENQRSLHKIAEAAHIIASPPTGITPRKLKVIK